MVKGDLESGGIFSPPCNWPPGKHAPEKPSNPGLMRGPKDRVRKNSQRSLRLAILQAFTLRKNGARLRVDQYPTCFLILQNLYPHIRYCPF
jgi:hypothetical protein